MPIYEQPDEDDILKIISGGRQGRPAVAAAAAPAASAACALQEAEHDRRRNQEEDRFILKVVQQRSMGLVEQASEEVQLPDHLVARGMPLPSPPGATVQLQKVDTSVLGKQQMQEESMMSATASEDLDHSSDAAGRITFVDSETQPGAFAVAPRTDTADASLMSPANNVIAVSLRDEVTDDANHNSNALMDHTLTTGYDGNLAVANLVDEDEEMQNPAGLPQADPINHVAREARKVKCRRNLAAVGCFAILILAIGAILLVIWLLNLTAGPNEIMIPSPQSSSSTMMGGNMDTNHQSVMSALSSDAVDAILADPDSPQSKALDWLVHDPFLDGYSPARMVRRHALASFYYATGGDTWVNNTHWLSYTVPECEWYVLGYDDSFLYFGYNMENKASYMDGEMDYNSACDEDGEFRRFWFGNNNLTGTVPPEIFQLTSVVSMGSVVHPSLTFPLIPSLLGRMTNLHTLMFLMNQHIGTIPSEIGLLTNVESLIWTQTEPSGGILPPEIGRLTNLLLLGVGSNVRAANGILICSYVLTCFSRLACRSYRN